MELFILSGLILISLYFVNKTPAPIAPRPPIYRINGATVITRAAWVRKP